MILTGPAYWYASVYAKTDCGASKPTDDTGDGHVHHCTGPSTHGGGEHLCECGEWWK